MNKQAPTVGKLAAMVIFALSCFAMLLFLWLSFGGSTPLKPKGYRVDIAFSEAVQLGTEAEVKVAGVTIGRVVDKRIPSPQSNLVVATLELDREHAPLGQDARAVLREKTLIGETYVELTLGSGEAPKIPDGGTLDPRRVRSVVKLDELLDTFDPYTRMQFRTWQRGLGEALDGRGPDLNDAIGNLPGFVDSAGDLVEELDANRAALRGLVRNSGVVLEALTADERQLARLVTGTDRTFNAIARRRDDFADVFQVLPTFLRESRATSRTLEGFSRRATPVLRDLAPATDDLAVSLRALGRAAPDLGSFLQSLRPLADAAEEGLPASTQVLRGLRPVLRSAEPYLGELNPLLAWIGEHSYTLTDMLSNLGVATAAKTVSRDPQATGHYLRQFGPVGAESLIGATDRIASNRGNTYLNPLTLASPEQAASGITAAWDCANAGEQPSPACRTEPGYRFQDQLRKFPHVQAETYRSGKPAVRSGR